MNTGTTTVAQWALSNGADASANASFGAGFHLVEVVFFALFAFLVSFTLLKRAIASAGF